jgi:hypothetical protein
VEVSDVDQIGHDLPAFRERLLEGGNLACVGEIECQRTEERPVDELDGAPENQSFRAL